MKNQKAQQRATPISDVTPIYHKNGENPLYTPEQWTRAKARLEESRRRYAADPSIYQNYITLMFNQLKQMSAEAKAVEAAGASTSTTPPANRTRNSRASRGS